MFRLVWLIALSLLLVGCSAVYAQDGAQSCTWVELQPGYPGYRGFVTGLFGAGEAACLEELQLANPAFDPVAEDAANAEAAAHLGISGDASTWLWENWLAIEAERGLVPACYRDAYFAMVNGMRFPSVEVDRSDPRMLLGQPGTTHWIDLTAIDLGMSGSIMRKYLMDDAIFRAHAWNQSGKTQPNAPELLDAGRAFMQDQSGSPQTYRLLMKRGGYAPVPDSACPEDQWFLAQVTGFTMYQGLVAPVASALLGDLEQQHRLWLTSVGYAEGTQSFRDYLEENWNVDWN